MIFTVAIADRDLKPHNACFGDFKKALVDALLALGHTVASQDHPKGQLILLGANDSNSKIPVPSNAILYNAEQVADSCEPVKLIAKSDPSRIIWDYSSRNVARWHQLGFDNAVLCPIGYIRSMSTIVSTKDQDIDVLFYGALNGRRTKILDEIKKAKIKVVHLSGVYGAVRDRWIARAKVVLNMHYYENGLFEIFRVSHLVANHKCVVSEAGGGDAALEMLNTHLTSAHPYDALVDACRQFVQNKVIRHAQEERGFEAFRCIDFVDSVRQALIASKIESTAQTG